MGGGGAGSSLVPSAAPTALPLPPSRTPSLTWCSGRVTTCGWRVARVAHGGVWKERGTAETGNPQLPAALGQRPPRLLFWARLVILGSWRTPAHPWRQGTVWCVALSSQLGWARTALLLVVRPFCRTPGQGPLQPGEQLCGLLSPNHPGDNSHSPAHWTGSCRAGEGLGQRQEVLLSGVAGRRAPTKSLHTQSHLVQGPACLLTTAAALGAVPQHL